MEGDVKHFSLIPSQRTFFLEFINIGVLAEELLNFVVLFGNKIVVVYKISFTQ